MLAISISILLLATIHVSLHLLLSRLSSTFCKTKEATTRIKLHTTAYLTLTSIIHFGQSSDTQHSPRRTMATSDEEKVALAAASMPQHPAPTATANNQDFLPSYEVNLNHNLQNFGQVEGQVGAHAMPPRQSKKQSPWKKRLMITVPILIVLLGLIIGAAIFFSGVPNRGSDRSNTPAHASVARNDQATVYATVT